MMPVPVAAVDSVSHHRVSIIPPMLLAFDLWTSALTVAGVLVAFFVIQYVHLACVFVWGDSKTRGLEYYGKPPEEREKFKRALRRHGVLLFPILRLLGTKKIKFESASFVHDGVAGPKGTCSEEAFAKAAAYEPTAQDVFVATQMKCGTTWMQHLVYEVLYRGNGDIVDAGKTLYGVCPWIEALKSIPLEEAPLHGEERPSRVIKTHLPTELCPYSKDAKYVYVVRQPVSCFASCVDFVATNIGTFAPKLDAVEAWFRNPELMWWGTWPAHVQGWWEWSQERDNVLFITFEEMKVDLTAVTRRVAEFLEMKPLSDEELGNVVRKCGFKYMQEHKDAFEMNPPHILQTDAELFVSGKADRHKDVPAETRQRIAQWCRAELEGKSFPLGDLYPDVAQA